MNKSYLTTHPYVRYLVFGAAALAGLYALSQIIGVDTVIRWTEGLAGSQGVNITQEVKP